MKDIIKLADIVIEISDYLKTHEDDIAWGINDFDELRTTFEFFFDRAPQKSSTMDEAHLKVLKRK